MKLITEEAQKVKFIVEQASPEKPKKMYIEGIFLQGDICNRNGRMYPIETLKKEVNRYTENFIAKGRALGELGHPMGPTVNLDRVSHKIICLEQKGRNFYGKAQLLETPMGKIAKSLIDEGVTLGVSSRGVGSLKQTSGGHKIVGEDFMLATAADIVADPSAPDAFVQGIMEDKEWVYDSINNLRIVESIKRSIENDSKNKELTEDRKLFHFDLFINSL
jgi:hypothetical protein